jgi:hypothetical protein
MNYCSIQEAWGNNSNYNNSPKDLIKKPLENNLDNNLNSKNNNIFTNPQHIEHFTNNNQQHIEKFTNNNMNHNEKFSNHIEKFTNNTCESFLSHIKSCSNCRIFIMKYCGSNLLVKLEQIINTNKDVLVLILIGICIILFFNIINSLTRKQN